MSIKHTIRTGFSENGEAEYGERDLTPLKAIVAHCQECYGFCQNVWKEVRECPSTLCALHPFREGEGHTGRTVSDEHLQRMQNARILQNRGDGIPE